MRKIRKKKKGLKLKRIPTKPERRLSPSDLGKGELEGSRLRLAKRILLLQSCQNCIHYTALRMGVENCIYLMLHRKRMETFLVLPIWVLFKDKCLVETSKMGGFLSLYVRTLSGMKIQTSPNLITEPSLEVWRGQIHGPSISETKRSP